MRRYLLLILCLSFALSSLMGQSSVLPNKANDDISVIVNDSLMFIGQNVDSLTEEQRYFNPLYLIVQKGKEYLKKQLIRASVCDCDTTVPNRRIGIFSVAPNKHVSFSQGNLQYFPAANLWKFADNQYEYLGASNKYLSPTYRNWVDLFGWSGEGSNAPFGVSTSTDNADYAGEFLDWGTNSICGDAANTWRTLSKNEWNYLLNDRKNATSLIGIANINGINGLVILPDSWTCPAGVTFKSGFHSSCGVDYYAAYQTFTADQWSKLEKSGAIFLPAAGYRRGSDVYDVQNYGSYWATEYNGYQANDLDFLSCVARMDTTSRYCGQSVRLVHDTIVTKSKIIWYTDEAIKEGSNGASGTGMAGWAYLHPEGRESTELNRRYQGKRINCIRLQVAQAGTFTVSVANRDRLDSIFNIQTIMLKDPSKEPQVYHLPQTIHLQKNQVLVFANPTDQARFYYSSYVGDISFADYVGHPDQTVRITEGPKTLNIDAGYYCEDGENCDTLAIPEPEYVDLGLSVKWATFNVGATSPEDYGDYFAWGETEPKTNYDWSTYKWCDGTESNITKYNDTDNLTTLLPEDDAAHVNWGGEWRMPSEAELTELREHCTWQWTTQNGIGGYVVTGPNGNSIFLPTTGYFNNNSLNLADSRGYYLSNSLSRDNPHKANMLYFTLDNVSKTSIHYRYCGQSIRPVLPTDREPLLPPAPCETFEVNGVAFNMMCVEGSTFMMGAMEGDSTASKNEFPQHSVTLSNYMIGQTEITKAQWLAVMGDKPKSAPDSWLTADLQTPANYVTWSECVEFADRLSQLTGHNFRLPTEAEWEFAARGGTLSQGYRYSGSNNLDKVGWYIHNRQQTTHPVATKLPNELGIYDMSGNVWEWCLDSPKDYKDYAQLDPLPAFVNNQRVIRGGAYERDENRCTTTHRTTWLSAWSQKGANIGFRVVLNDEHIIRTILLPDSIAFNMKHINGGTFMMGQTEVTQALWKVVMGTTPENEYNSSTSGDALMQVGDNLPMAYLSWNDAQKFVERLNAMTGLYFRLPTEAEWIYAAKGGQRSKGYKYSGSDSLEEVAWCATNANGEIKPVGLLKPNELGIYDMCGNVWEFCNDVQSDGKIVAHGCSSSESWSAAHYRPEYRYLLAKTYKANRLGLRLVMDTAKYIPTPCETFEVNGVKFNMMCVEGGTFMMGTGSAAHQVTLSDYKIAQTELTQGLWEAVMGSDYNTILSKNNADIICLGPTHPAYALTWIDCQEFVNKLNQLTGLNFRMSTEAEWEFAARGGNRSRGYTYAGSNDLDAVAWHGLNSDNLVHPVAQKLPNELGIYDMAGNAWELCLDGYAAYATYSQTNPIIPVKGDVVARGGSSYNGWSDDIWLPTHRLNRSLVAPRTRNTLRLVLSDEVTVKTVVIDNNLTFNMIGVNSGTFMMGQTEVTQALWKAVMGTTLENEYNSSTSGDPLLQVGDNLPMAYLSWNDAQKFVERLNAMTGLYFRLPTEAEWIYAAKGGQLSKGYKFAGSDILEEVAWCGTNANGAIKQVGLLKPNELGIYDMSGNVWEYCSDVLGTGEIFSHGGSSYPGWNETYSDLEYRNIRSKANKAGRLGLRLVMDTAKYIPTPCKTFEVNGVKFNMMCVEGGTMTIGAGDIMEYRRRPEHKTTISDFYIGQTQVTQELWQAVMGDNPSVFKSDTSSSHPVENVSVIDIQEFLTKLNAMTGVNFRLPTEAEWEYAARGGQKSKGFMYAGSDDRNQVAWYGVSDKNGGTTHPVAQKRPNELGLYDMHGNVWEWLHDKYTDIINVYPSVNPTGLISNLKASPVACGSAYYSDLGPSNAWGWVGVGSISTRSSWFGFRLALSDEDPFMAIDVNNYRFHMMLVKGGTFQMGAASTDATALENERPAHQVTLPDYYAGQTEVTRALWKTVMGSLPDGGEADNKPITNVNYDECQTFITQLNDLTGRHFRLPTEAEWEFAARGGNQSKGYKYAGSNDVDSVAWWQETSGDTIHPVAQLMPNELGIYDMSGNVFEWCSDWYGDYASNAQINPQGAASGTQRVGRGGGYRAEDNRCRVTRRIPTDPEQRMTTLGLRLVLDKHAYVDLGLSVLWATTNLGATQPEEYGDYFAWGETEPKDSYTRDNYKWRDNTKYNNSGGLTSIQLEDDAAHVNWGGEWRMPTKEEYSELIEKCTWTWTQHKGINGYQVTGPNGNSIFLPATGYIGNGPSYPVGEYGLYWTTELKSSSINSSYILIFGKNYTQRPSPNGSRFYGFSIRPVCPPPSI